MIRFRHLLRPLLLGLLALALLGQGMLLRPPVQEPAPGNAGTVVLALLSPSAELAGSGSPLAWEGAPVEAIGETLAALTAMASADPGRGMESPHAGPDGVKRSPYLGGIERPPRA